MVYSLNVICKYATNHDVKNANIAPVTADDISLKSLHSFQELTSKSAHSHIASTSARCMQRMCS